MNNELFANARRLQNEGKLSAEWVYTSEQLKSLRHNLGLTQDELGQLLGINPKTITRWEREGASGIANVALVALEKYCGDLLFAKCSRENICVDAYSRRFYATAGTPNEETKNHPPPNEFDAAHIRSLQERLGVSRMDFAKLLNVTVGTVDKLNSGRLKASGPLLVILSILWSQGAGGFSEFSSKICPATRRKAS